MAIVYKLIIGDYHYFGMTTQSFRARYMAHKKSCFNRSKKSYWTKLYKSIRELGVKKSAWEDKVKYKIIYKDCADDEIAYYEYACINTSNPWNLNTMDKDVPEFFKKELVKWGTIIDKPKYDRERQKEWCNKNKEKRAEVSKNYVNRNKDKVSKKKSEWYNEKVLCEVCNCEVSKGNYPRHTRSTKHIRNIN